MIITLAFLIALMPSTFCFGYAQPSNPAQTAIAVSVPPQPASANAVNSIITDPPAPVYASSSTYNTRGYIIANDTGPQIPLVTNFVSIPYPFASPSATDLQEWSVVSNTSLFQTLYQAYGSNSIGGTSGYTRNSTSSGWVIDTSWGEYCWIFVHFNNGTTIYNAYFLPLLPVTGGSDIASA